MEPKILFILHLPNPVHGSSMVGQYIKNSKIINSSFDAKYIDLSTSKTVEEIGKKPIIKIGRYIKILFQVILALINHDPKVVYLAITAKGIGFYKDLPIALFAKLFGKKLILHYHNKGVSNYHHRLLDNFLYSTLFNNTKVILLSRRLYYDVWKYVKKENIFYCPNGIPVVAFEEKISVINNGVPKLLFLSNLIETKGVYFLLDALKILQVNGVKFHCNFVGGEGDISSKEFIDKVESMNLRESVTYLGRMYDNDKYSIFELSDIFIFPTHYHNECFPLVLLEAMMFELPVISTDEGGIADIVEHNETGIIVNNGNTNDLAQGIKKLLDNPNLCLEMGKKGGIKFRSEYTLEVFESRIKSILSQA